MLKSFVNTLILFVNTLIRFSLLLLQCKNRNFHRVFPLCCTLCNFAVNCKKKIKETERRKRRRQRSALMSQKRCQRSLSSGRAEQSSTAFMQYIHTHRHASRLFHTHTAAHREQLALMHTLSHTLHLDVAQKPPPLKLCMRRARARLSVCLRVCECLCAAFTSFTFIALVVVAAAAAVFVETLKNHAGVNPRNLNLNCICMYVCVSENFAAIKAKEMALLLHIYLPFAFAHYVRISFVIVILLYC